MGNGLIRAMVVAVGVDFNGDKNDHKVRSKIEDLNAQIRETENRISDLKSQLPDGGAPIKGQLTKAEKKLTELKLEYEETNPDKDNSIVAVLHYPRSGSSSVMATAPADVPSTKPWRNDGAQDFLESGLFKEVVHGETILSIMISDRDKKNPFWVFTRKVLGAIFGAVSGGAISGISEVVVSSTAAQISEVLKGSLTGSGKDRSDIVAESKKVKMRIEGDEIEVLNQGEGITYQDGVLKLDLVAPRTFFLGHEVVSEQGSVKKIEKVLPKGAPNGSISLKLALDRIP